MTADKCTDPEAGALVHAWELGALPDEDAERFEIHLLRCPSCFATVQRFERQATLLREDADIRSQVQSAVVGETGQASVARRLRDYLWPGTPLVFRPALALVVIMLLIYPAYRGIQRLAGGDIEEVQMIHLFPSRAASDAVFRAGPGTDGVISFVFRGAVPGQSYRVTVAMEDGAVLWRDNSYASFDEYETGRLLLPASLMQPGRYEVRITDPDGSPPANEQTYTFTIEP
ncbi:MAG TPA: zf-HC2 domain-containing protein [Acidobacteriota bacterium]|nr:zf-HC2 domain-containing protein [Acidobacteriota bacterium]